MRGFFMDILRSTATEQFEAIKKKEISAHELLDLTYEQIDKVIITKAV